MLNRVILLLTFSATLTFASGGGGETDILPRTVNFLIFASLVYYLLAEPIKKLFVERKESIAAAFEKIQEKLKEAEAKKEQAKKDLENAKAKAVEIVENSKVEAELIKDKLVAQCKTDVEILHKQKEEAKEVARNQMIRAVVRDELQKIFASSDLKTDSSDILESLVKKVA